MMEYNELYVYQLLQAPNLSCLTSLSFVLNKFASNYDISDNLK